MNLLFCLKLSNLLVYSVTLVFSLSRAISWEYLLDGCVGSYCSCTIRFAIRDSLSGSAQSFDPGGLQSITEDVFHSPSRTVTLQKIAVPN